MKAQSRPWTYRALLASAAMSPMIFGHAAWAQSVPAAAAQPSAASSSTAPGENAAMPEVVVTAQKRRENLQKTPVAVTALTATQIEASGITGGQQLQREVPSLTFGNNNGYNYISLRGIGSDTITTAAETSVGTYIDGVYINGLLTESIPNADLERIEVLRGPQGTLYGRNTTGGVINYITKAPSFTPGANLAASYGNYDSRSFDAGATGPLIGDLAAFRVSGHYDDNDGYRFNLDTHERGDSSQTTSMRGTVLFKPSSTVTFTLRGDFARNYSSNPSELLSEHSADGLASQSTPLGLFSQPAAVLAQIPGLLSPADLAKLNGGSIAQLFNLIQPGPTAPNPNKSLDYSNALPNRFRVDSAGASGTLDWDFGSASMKSITAYRYSRLDLSSDNAGSGAQFVGLSPLDQKGHQFTQEIDFSGKALDGKLDWLVGGFYFHDKSSVVVDIFLPATTQTAIAGLSFANSNAAYPYQLNLSQPYLANLFQVASPLATVEGSGSDPLTGQVLTAGVSVPSTAFIGYKTDQTSESIAGFAQATYHVTDRLRLSGGFRYTQDKKDVDRTSHSNLLVALGEAAALCQDAEASKTWSSPTGTAGLDYDISRHVLGYAKISFGYKAGGFNPSECSGSFNPEKLTAYETGLKTTLADGQVRLNVAGYYYDYSDIQFTTYIDANSTIKNAGSATAYGIEAEYRIYPRSFEGFSIDGSASYEHSSYGHGLFQDSAFQFPGAGADIGGNSLIRAPEWKADFGAQYAKPIAAGGVVTLRGEAAYTSDIANDIFNGGVPFASQTTQPGYWLLNAYLGWVSSDGGLSAQLFGDNLTNEYYTTIRAEVNTPSSVIGTTGRFAPPRTFGVRLAMKFGSSVTPPK